MTDNHTQPSQQVPVAIDERSALIVMCRLQIAANKKQQTVIAWSEPETPKRILAALLAKSAPDAGLAEDAKRYRFLRSNSHGALYDSLYCNKAEYWDVLIDAALASQEPQHG